MLKIFWKKIPSSQKDQLYLDTTDFQFFQIFKNRSLMTTNIKSIVICHLGTRFKRKKKRNKLVWKRTFWSSAQVQFKNTSIFIFQWFDSDFNPRIKSDWRDSDFIPRFCKIFEISKSFSLILLSVKNEPCTPNLGTLLSKQVEIIAKKVSNFKTGLFWSKSQNFQKLFMPL